MTTIRNNRKHPLEHYFGHDILSLIYSFDGTFHKNKKIQEKWAYEIYLKSIYNKLIYLMRQETVIGETNLNTPKIHLHNIYNILCDIKENNLISTKDILAELLDTVIFTEINGTNYKKYLYYFSNPYYFNRIFKGVKYIDGLHDESNLFFDAQGNLWGIDNAGLCGLYKVSFRYFDIYILLFVTHMSYYFVDEDF